MTFETERNPLAVWMDPNEGWKAVPRESELYEFVAEAAGCDGRVFANTRLSELVMCDGSDLVLWKMGDTQKRASEFNAERRIEESVLKAVAEERARCAQFNVALEEMLERQQAQAVAKEREACARIADIHRAWWEEGENSGAAAAANIARAIRKRTPERGGDVVDDAGAGAAVRAGPTKHSSQGGSNDD